MTWPTWSYDAMSAVFARARCGACVAGTDACAVADTRTDDGSRPDTLAELSARPASTLTWVVVAEPVHVTEAPGTSVSGCAGEQSRVPTSGSAIVTAVSVTLPSFIAVSV